MKTGSGESDVRNVRGEGGEAILGCREAFSDFFNKLTVSWQSEVQSVKYCCFPLLSFFFWHSFLFFGRNYKKMSLHSEECFAQGRIGHQASSSTQCQVAVWNEFLVGIDI